MLDAGTHRVPSVFDRHVAPAVAAAVKQAAGESAPV